MAVIFSLDQGAVKIQIKVMDCVTDTVFDISQVISQRIIFYKSDGTKIIKDAVLVEDTANLGQFFIQYVILNADDILTLNSLLEYSGEITLSDNEIAQTSQRQVSWVV